MLLSCGLRMTNNHCVPIAMIQNHCRLILVRFTNPVGLLEKIQNHSEPDSRIQIRSLPDSIFRIIVDPSQNDSEPLSVLSDSSHGCCGHFYLPSSPPPFSILVLESFGKVCPNVVSEHNDVRHYSLLPLKCPSQRL